MATESFEERSIRVLNFSGRKTDFPVWSEKFLAKARRKGYKDMLIGGQRIPKELDVLTDTTAEDKAKIKIR